MTESVLSVQNISYSIRLWITRNMHVHVFSTVGAVQCELNGKVFT